MHPYTRKLTYLRRQAWDTYAHLTKIRFLFNAKAIQVCGAAADVHEVLSFSLRLTPPEIALSVATQTLKGQVGRASGLALQYKQAVLDQLRRLHAQAD